MAAISQVEKRRQNRRGWEKRRRSERTVIGCGRVEWRKTPEMSMACHDYKSPHQWKPRLAPPGSLAALCLSNLEVGL